MSPSFNAKVYISPWNNRSEFGMCIDDILEITRETAEFIRVVGDIVADSKEICSGSAGTNPAKRNVLTISVRLSVASWRAAREMTAWKLCIGSWKMNQTFPVTGVWHISAAPEIYSLLAWSIIIRCSRLWPASNSITRYCLYLYGVVQRIMGLHALAVKTLEAALKREPSLWAAWVELSLICKSKDEVLSLDVPYSWITLIFLGTTLTAVEPSLPLVQQIWSKLESIFPECAFLMTHKAVGLNAQYPPDVSATNRNENYHVLWEIINRC